MQMSATKEGFSNKNDVRLKALLVAKHSSIQILLALVVQFDLELVNVM